MSEAATLITPAEGTTQASETVTDNAAAPAAAETATEVTLITPEPVQGEAAAAADQGDGKGDAATESGQSDAGKAEGEEIEGEKAEDAVTGAPEAYAEFSMPEGYEIPADFGAELATMAKGLNLPQDAAQRLIDIGVKHSQGIVQAVTDQMAAARTQWTDATRADAEIGGEKLSVNMAVAKQALVAFGTPELTKVLNETGMGLHPEFLRLLFRVGGAISEDTIVEGGNGDGGRPAMRDHAKSLYPGMK